MAGLMATDEFAAALVAMGRREFYLARHPQPRKAPRKPPRTHLHKEMVEKRRNPAPSAKPRVEMVLRALAAGDQSQVEELLARGGEEPVPEEWQQRYKADGKAYWDQFYREKTTNFFKDRHYLREELSELMPPEIAADPRSWVDNAPALTASAASAPSAVLLELGCAVGNGVLPLLRAAPGLFAYACDLSPVAVDLLREKPEYACGRCAAFACDITRGPGEQPTDEHHALEDEVPGGSVDFATLIFVLSAIDPELHAGVLGRVFTSLRPGGSVMVRDYGRGDLAQVRFGAGHWLGGDLYVRGDGTLAYFFTEEGLRKVCEAVGFETLECEYRRNDIVNRARDIQMPRIWVQGKFRRPA